MPLHLISLLLFLLNPTSSLRTPFPMFVTHPPVHQVHQVNLEILKSITVQGTHVRGYNKTPSDMNEAPLCYKVELDLVELQFGISPIAPILLL